MRRSITNRPSLLFKCILCIGPINNWLSISKKYGIDYQLIMIVNNYGTNNIRQITVIGVGCKNTKKKTDVKQKR